MNEYFTKLCDIVRNALYDSNNYEHCLSDMIEASYDEEHNINVYNDARLNISVIKLDEYTKDFVSKRKHQYEKNNGNNKGIFDAPAAVDAVCVNKNNEWFLIEFKNQKLKEVVKDVPKKMLSSLWLILYLYSESNNEISFDSDVLKFAREHITFITVVNSEKNTDYLDAIGLIWEKDGSHYTPEKFIKYKGYYFKDVYILTEKGLSFFVKNFEMD